MSVPPPGTPISTIHVIAELFAERDEKGNAANVRVIVAPGVTSDVLGAARAAFGKVLSVAGTLSTEEPVHDVGSVDTAVFGGQMNEVYLICTPRNSRPVMGVDLLSVYPMDPSAGVEMKVGLSTYIGICAPVGIVVISETKFVRALDVKAVDDLLGKEVENLAKMELRAGPRNLRPNSPHVADINFLMPGPNGSSFCKTMACVRQAINVFNQTRNAMTDVNLAEIKCNFVASEQGCTLFNYTDEMIPKTKVAVGEFLKRASTPDGQRSLSMEFSIQVSGIPLSFIPAEPSIPGNGFILSVLHGTMCNYVFFNATMKPETLDESVPKISDALKSVESKTARVSTTGLFEAVRVGCREVFVPLVRALKKMTEQKDVSGLNEVGSLEPFGVSLSSDCIGYEAAHWNKGRYYSEAIAAIVRQRPPGYTINEVLSKLMHNRQVTVSSQHLSSGPMATLSNILWKITGAPLHLPSVREVARNRPVLPGVARAIQNKSSGDVSSSMLSPLVREEIRQLQAESARMVLGQSELHAELLRASIQLEGLQEDKKKPKDPKQIERSKEIEQAMESIRKRIEEMAAHRRKCEERVEQITTTDDTVKLARCAIALDSIQRGLNATLCAVLVTASVLNRNVRASLDLGAAAAESVCVGSTSDSMGGDEFAGASIQSSASATVLAGCSVLIDIVQSVQKNISLAKAAVAAAAAFAAGSRDGATLLRNMRISMKDTGEDELDWITKAPGAAVNGAFEHAVNTAYAIYTLQKPTPASVEALVKRGGSHDIATFLAYTSFIVSRNAPASSDMEFLLTSFDEAAVNRAVELLKELPRPESAFKEHVDSCLRSVQGRSLKAFMDRVHDAVRRKTVILIGVDGTSIPPPAHLASAMTTGVNNVGRHILMESLCKAPLVQAVSVVNVYAATMARLEIPPETLNNILRVRRHYEDALLTANMFLESIPGAGNVPRGSAPIGLPDAGQVIGEIGPVLAAAVRANRAASKATELVQTSNAADDKKITSKTTKEFAESLSQIATYVEAAHEALTKRGDPHLWPAAKFCALVVLSVSPFNQDVKFVEKAQFIATRSVPAWDVLAGHMLESLSRGDSTADRLEPHVHALGAELYAYDEKVAAAGAVAMPESPLAFGCIRAACIKRRVDIKGIIQNPRRQRGKADQEPVVIDLRAALASDNEARNRNSWFWNPSRAAEDAIQSDQRVFRRRAVFMSAIKEFVSDYDAVNVLGFGLRPTEEAKRTSIPAGSLDPDLTRGYENEIKKAFRDAIKKYTESPEQNIDAYYIAWETLGKILHRTVTRRPHSHAFGSTDASTASLVRTVLSFITPGSEEPFAGDCNGRRIVYTNVRALCEQLRSMVKPDTLKDIQYTECRVDRVINGHRDFQERAREVIRNLIGEFRIDRGTVEFAITGEERKALLGMNRRGRAAAPAAAGEAPAAAAEEKKEQKVHEKYFGEVGKCVVAILRQKKYLKPVHLLLLSMDMYSTDKTWEQHQKKRPKALRSKEVMKEFREMAKLASEDAVESSAAFTQEEKDQFNELAVAGVLDGSAVYIRTKPVLHFDSRTVFVSHPMSRDKVRDAANNVRDMHDAMLRGHVDRAYGNICMFDYITNELSELSGAQADALYVSYGLTVARACLTLSKALRGSQLELKLSESCIPPAPLFSVKTLKAVFVKITKNKHVKRFYDACYRMHARQSRSRNIPVPTADLSEIVPINAANLGKRKASDALDSNKINALSRWANTEQAYADPLQYTCSSFFALMSAFVSMPEARTGRLTDIELTRLFYKAVGDRGRVVSDKESAFPFSTFPPSTDFRVDTTIPEVYQHLVDLGKLWLDRTGVAKRVIRSKRQ